MNGAGGACGEGSGVAVIYEYECPVLGNGF